MSLVRENSIFEANTDFYRSLEILRERYDLGQLKAEPQKLCGGSLHEMWYLSTAAGDYALKRVNEKNWTLLENTILAVDKAEELARHHQEKGLLTRTAIKSLNNKYIERCHLNQAWMLFPWIDGVIRSPAEITTTDAYCAGELLNQIQSSAPMLQGLKLPHWFGFESEHWQHLIQEAEQKSLNWAVTAKEEKKLLHHWSAAASAAALALQKNLISSHRDLSFSNVIWRPDQKPVVIDWEYAGLVNPDSEIYNTAMTWSFRGEGRFDSQYFDAFLEGAKERLTLDIPTLKAGFAGYLLEWCEFNMRRSLSSEAKLDLANSEVLSVLSILKQY